MFCSTAYVCLYFQGATGFPGAAGRVGPPGPNVSSESNPLLSTTQVCDQMVNKLTQRIVSKSISVMQ